MTRDIVAAIAVDDDFAGDNVPRTVLLLIVGGPNMTGTTTSTNRKDSDVRDEAQRMRRNLLLHHVIKNGMIENCNDQKDSYVGDEAQSKRLNETFKYHQ